MTGTTTGGPLLTHRLLAIGNPVGGSATAPMRGQAPVLVKVNSSEHCLWAQYEHVCAWLARLLGLRCAPVQLTVWEGKVASMSLWIDDPDNTPPPVVPPDIVGRNPADAAGVVLFDQWIGNNDRHDRNLVLSEAGEPVLIDHSHAFFASFDGGSMKQTIDNTRDNLIVNHCLVPHITGSASVFDPWLSRLDRVQPEVYGLELDRLVVDGFLSDEQGQVLLELLNDRRARMRELIATMLPGLEGW